MTNAQAQETQNRIKVLEQRINTLNDASEHYQRGSTEYITLSTTITEFELEAHTLRKSLNTRRDWLFNFVGGGWNSVTAYTLEEAIETATTKYSGMGMDVDPATFRVSTPTDHTNLLSIFH